MLPTILHLLKTPGAAFVKIIEKESDPFGKIEPDPCFRSRDLKGGTL
jgi:hypothetical protein